MNSMLKAPLLFFRGGQDSTTCLAWALDRFQRVETVGFQYGQVHAIEMTMRETLRSKVAVLRSGWTDRLGEDHVHDASVIGAISHTRLTGATETLLRSEDLPDTFVPGRNLVF